MKIKKFFALFIAVIFICSSFFTASASSSPYVTFRRMCGDRPFYDYTVFSYGESVTLGLKDIAFDGVAADSSALNYEWYMNDVLIEDSNCNPYTFTVTEGGKMTCYVYDGEQCVVSCDFILCVDTISVSAASSNPIESDEDIGDEYFYVKECVLGSDITINLNAASHVGGTLSYTWYKLDIYMMPESDAISTENSVTVTKDKGYEYYSCDIFDGTYTKNVTVKLEPTKTLNESITINGIYPKRFERGYMAVAKTGEQVTFSVETASTNGEVSQRWEGYDQNYDPIDLGTGKTLTVTKQDIADDDFFGFEMFECYLDDGNEVIQVGFVLFSIDPNQVTAESIITEGAPNITLVNTEEELANRLLQDNMEQLLDEKAAANITLSADIQQSLAADEQAAVEQAIGENGQIELCLDLNLYKEIQDTTTEITETAKEIALSVDVPEALKEKAANEQLVITRVHNGVAENLSGKYDFDTNKFTFATDKFSTYVLSSSSKEAISENIVIDRLSITVNEADKTLDAVVNSAYLSNNADLSVSFSQSESITVVTDYTTVGNNLVFSYTTVSNDAVSITLSGGDASYALNLDPARFDGDAGTMYTVFTSLFYGDANGDGSIDIKDIVRTKKAITGSANATDDADINGDGKIVAADLTLLAKYIITAKTGMLTHTVTFKDADGAVLEELAVPSGFKAVPGIIPTEDKNGNIFDRWDSSLSNISANTIITAVYGNNVSGSVPEDWPYDGEN